MKSLTTTLAIMACMSGCHAKEAKEATRTMQQASRSESAASLADAGAIVPVPSSTDAMTSPCVLHAGNGQIRKRTILLPGGKPGKVTESTKCSFNAECVSAQGESSPGDGNVELACVEHECRCVRILLSKPRKTTAFTFTAEPPCSTTEQAQKLLVDRCMEGLKTVQRDNAGG